MPGFVSDSIKPVKTGWKGEAMNEAKILGNQRKNWMPFIREREIDARKQAAIRGNTG